MWKVLRWSFQIGNNFFLGGSRMGNNHKFMPKKKRKRYWQIYHGAIRVRHGNFRPACNIKMHILITEDYVYIRSNRTSSLNGLNLLEYDKKLRLIVFRMWVTCRDMVNTHLLNMFLSCHRYMIITTILFY